MIGFGKPRFAALIMVLALCAVSLPAAAQDALPTTSFAPAESSASLTPLDRCIRDVQRLERDEIGVPYLAAGYIAFFAVFVAFFVVAQSKQRKLESEMAELRARLAKLQEGAR